MPIVPSSLSRTGRLWEMRMLRWMMESARIPATLSPYGSMCRYLRYFSINKLPAHLLAHQDVGGTDAVGDEGFRHRPRDAVRGAPSGAVRGHHNGGIDLLQSRDGLWNDR